MNDNVSFQRFTAVTAIISFLFAAASDVLQGIPVHFNSEVATNPALFLAVETSGGRLLRSGLLLDMLGYYLPLLPLALFLYQWLKTKSPLWMRFYTACGFGYILIGAVGAVAVAVVQPPLINAYAQTSTEQRAVLETVFGAIWSIVYAGLWNILGELLIGIWFLGVGWLLRSELRVPGMVGMFIGCAALLDSLGMMLGIEGLALLGLSLFLILAPLWMLWVGIELLRKPIQIQAVSPN